MKAYFTASQFTAMEKFDTAEDKAKFANHFMRFVESGFKWSLFYDWFYRRLSMTFGHIAHFNRHGFYAEFFQTTADKLRFLKQTVNPPLGFCGDAKYTYVDVEVAVAEKVQAGGLLGEWEIKLEQETEERERAELERLKAKYENAGK